MNKTQNFSARQRRIYGRIIEALEDNDVRLARGSWGVHVDEGGVQELDGPVCAVGAGCLWRPSQAKGASPVEAFANAHGVSVVFAAGVSDGFEGARPSHSASAARRTTKNLTSFYANADIPTGRDDLRDYRSGVKTGRAVALRLEEFGKDR